MELTGITSLSPRSPFATASIVVRTGQTPLKRIVGVGAHVAASYWVEEIHPESVVLRNENVWPPTREQLMLFPTTEGVVRPED